MKRGQIELTLTLLLSLGLIVAFLFLAGSTAGPALAQGGSGTIRVAKNHPSSLDYAACGHEVIPCETLQYAVDLALPGDEVLVAAGTYTDWNSYGGMDQVVYISKTLALRGGYTHTNWTLSDPDQYPTLIDALTGPRGILITGPITVTIEGLDITNGNGSDWGGCAPDAGDCGGGVYAHHANLALLKNNIYGNVGSFNDVGYGGGVYIRAAPTSTILISDCDISDNVATTGHTTSDGYGGGVSLSGGEATVQASRITGNEASGGGKGYGGGLSSHETTLIISGTLLSGNTASEAGNGKGGGVYVGESSTATLAANTVSGNGAAIGDGAFGWGGGLYSASGATLALVDNTFSANWAAAGANGIGFGGGINSYLAAKLSLAGNTFQDNIAVDGEQGGGGGAHIYGTTSQVLIKANDFVDNTAAFSGIVGRGGGLYLHDLAVTLEDNKFLGNIAIRGVLSDGIGGGIHVVSWVEMTMTNNLVAGNWAPAMGDGMFFGGSESDASHGRLIHNTFADNGPPSETGAASSTGATAGRGIELNGLGSSLMMTGTLLSGHGEAGLVVGVDTTANLEATLWHGNGVNITGTGMVTTGVINLQDDPAYAGPDDSDYHLTANSAALDAGIDAGVYNDLDGVLRPALAGFDIGAYEFPYGAGLTPNRTGYGQPGQVVTYTHTLTNLGGVTDSFALSHASDRGWTVTYGGPYTLSAGVSHTLVVSLEVPAAAVSGTLDTTVLTATSLGGPLVAASVEDRTAVTVTVKPPALPKVYLPVVLKNQ